MDEWFAFSVVEWQPQISRVKRELDYSTVVLHNIDSIHVIGSYFDENCSTYMVKPEEK